MSILLKTILDAFGNTFQGRFEDNPTDGGITPHSIIEIAGTGIGVNSENPFPVSDAHLPAPNLDGGVPVHINNLPSTQAVVAPSAGTGTSNSQNPPTELTQLVSGTVVHPGQLYVQNQSANTLQLWLQGAAGPILLASGAGTNTQGADWSAAVNMPWFVGTYTINGTSGAQFYANSN